MKQLQKNIGIFTANSLRFYSGGEIILINISKGLADLGIENTIYENESFPGPFRVDDSYLKDREIEFERAKFQPVNRFSSFFFQQIPFKKCLEINPVNLIIIWRLPSRRQMKELNSSLSKKIFLLHGIGFEKLRLSPALMLAYQFFMRIQLILIRKPLLQGNNYFQVINRLQKKILIHTGLPEDRIFLIENGIEPEKYSAIKNNLRFNVLFIGRIENLQKGIKRLIRVAKYVKRRNDDISFTVIGGGKYSSKIKSVHLINYLGFVSEETKIAELSNANLFVMTSNTEGFPLTVLEALFSGLPVVSTPLAGVIDIMESSGDFGKMPGFSPRKIGEEVLNYYREWKSNPDEFFKRKVSRSYNSKEKFDQEKMMMKYYDMINKVLSARL